MPLFYKRLKTILFSRGLAMYEEALYKLALAITLIHFAGWNECGIDNGGCSHLCVALSPEARGSGRDDCACPNHLSFDGTNQSCHCAYHCACPTHYQLGPDNLTCLRKFKTHGQLLHACTHSQMYVHMYIDVCTQIHTYINKYVNK